MRVAVWHNLPSGGGKRALYDHVKSLLESGHHVESWCPDSADQTYLPLSDLVEEHIVPLPSALSRVSTVLKDIATDTNESILSMDEHCRVCTTEIEHGNFDVLFANSCAFFGVTAIGRMSSLPSVLYLQEPYRRLYEAHPAPPWGALPRRRAWWIRPAQISREIRRAVVHRRNAVQIREEVRNAAGFGTILCNSYYSRESILRAYGLNASVCYLGVDSDRFSPRQDRSRQRFFLTVGACIPTKDVDFLIRSLAQRDDLSRSLVWVANDVNEALLAQLQGLARDLGVQVDIRIQVSDDELAELYRQAALFIYSPRLEPFGLAPLEAAASCLPTVAVAEAGTRETVVDGVTGLLVDRDTAEFSRAVDQVLGDADMFASLAAEARRYVLERWRSVEAGKRLESALEQAIAVRDQE